MQKATEWIRHGRLFAAIEVSTILSLILLQIWIFQGRNNWGAYLAAIIILGGWIVRKESLKTLGLVGKWGVIAIAVVFVGKTIVRHSAFFQSHFPFHTTQSETIALKVSVYFFWATVQQLILNGFFVNRLRCVTAGHDLPTLTWAGIIFGAVHSPNKFLMVVAGIGGIGAGYVFLQKKRNIYLIAIAHDLIGMSILYFLPPAWHHNMRVGPGFYFYQ